MKLTSTSSAVVSNAQSVSMSIDMNEHMFNMLTSNVYTDTILAPMREWSTNAIDACVEAGFDIQFDVHLPTLTEPYFSVRDYGTGLSDEDVRGLFSILGASTKRESNAYNGAFGIGRMAGLAYCKDAFTVISFYNGTKSSYLITTNSGLPEIMVLSTVDTKEPNGLLLSINVQVKDIEAFQKRAVDLYKYFEYKPNLNIELDLNNGKSQAAIKGKTWYIEAGNSTSRYNNKPVVIMGNVVYTIPINEFPETNYKNLLYNTNLRIEVPLGSVGITPGRESMSVDENTREYLTEVFTKILSEIEDNLLENIKKIKNPWEKYTAYNEALQSLPNQIAKLITYTVPPLEKSTFTTNGKRHHYNLALVYIKKFEHPGLSFRLLSRGYVSLSNPATSKYGGFGRGFSGAISKNIKFLICDIQYKHLDAAIAFRGTNDYIVLIQPQKYHKDKIQEFISNAKRYLRQIGYPSVDLASDYFTYVAPVTKAGKPANNDFSLMHINPYGTHSVRFTSSYDNVPTTAITFYVNCSGFSLLDASEKNTLHINTLLRTVLLHNEYRKSKPIKVVGIPKKGKSYVEAADNFIELTTENLRPYVKGLSYVDSSDIHKLQDMFRGIYYNTRDYENIKKANIPTGLKHLLQTCIEFNTKYQKQYPRTATKDIEKYFDLDIIKPKLTYTVENVKADYPKLSAYWDTHVRVWNVSKAVEELEHYINLEAKLKGLI